MQTIAIVDYGMGNVRSVQKALEHVAPNDNCILTSDPKFIRDSDRIVFPGQGAMGSCMSALEENSLIDEIKFSFQSKPFLGICLGLQLLFESSEEDKGTNGLSIVPGEVVKFKDNALKIPHMGWNYVQTNNSKNEFLKKDKKYRFYFVHSYHVKCDHENDILFTSSYGNEFHSAIKKDNLIGMQFHPEKSLHFGMDIFESFAKL